jgi:2,4-dienoyl-CoA reductase-like NADH-dependent reductase (Old Yellow Enzyme family)/thioredoxin reductase
VFPRLFTPGKIGSMEIKNRIIMAPMGSDYFDEEGRILDKMLDYYEERALGGAGLITIEACYISFAGKYRGRIDDDKYIPDFKRLVDVIHKGGAKTVLQIHNRKRGLEIVEPHIGRVAASDYDDPLSGEHVRGLTLEEVEGIIQDVGKAALRAKKAGFDGVNLHMCHGHMICTFWSPHTNRRTDKYGGCQENMFRFSTEMVECVKQYTGKDFPVIVKISADSRVKGGFSLPGAINLCKELEKAGADAIDVVSCFDQTYEWLCAPMYAPRGYNIPLAEAIKKEIKIPVTCAGRIDDPAFAEDLLATGKLDFVDLGRALLADPEFPNKAREGLVDDIRKCLACTECLSRVWKGDKINAQTGKEKELKIKPAAKIKNVLIIGGGAGGMETARVAALRGHKVTIVEKDSVLGGQLILAAAGPSKETIGGFNEYLIRQIKKGGVKIELNKELSVEDILKRKSDAVVVATGADPLIPNIPGMKNHKIITARNVLGKKVETGKNVIVIGGGMVGCETADFLAEQGKKVTIIEMLDKFAADTPFFINRFLVPKLENNKVKMMAKTKCQEILDSGVKVTDASGKEQIIKGDTVVIAVGSVSNSKLYEALKGKVSELYQAGDCVKARKILETVHEGYNIGMKL